MAITQGDEYTIPIIITQGDTIITDQMVSGVKVALGTNVCTYPDGKLSYSNGAWQFPLTQAQSCSLKVGRVDFQVQVKMGSQIVSSTKSTVDVRENIIKGEW